VELKETSGRGPTLHTPEGMAHPPRGPIVVDDAKGLPPAGKKQNAEGARAESQTGRSLCSQRGRSHAVRAEATDTYAVR